MLVLQLCYVIKLFKCPMINPLKDYLEEEFKMIAAADFELTFKGSV